MIDVSMAVVAVGYTMWILCLYLIQSVCIIVLLQYILKFRWLLLARLLE